MLRNQSPHKIFFFLLTFSEHIWMSFVNTGKDNFMVSICNAVIRLFSCLFSDTFFSKHKNILHILQTWGLCLLVKDALNMMGYLAKWFSKREKCIYFVKNSQNILTYNHIYLNQLRPLL